MESSPSTFIAPQTTNDDLNTIIQGLKYQNESDKQRFKQREQELLDAIKEKDNEIENLKRRTFILDKQHQEQKENNNSLQIPTPISPKGNSTNYLLEKKCNDYENELKNLKLQMNIMKESKEKLLKNCDELSYRVIDSDRERDDLKKLCLKLEDELNCIKGVNKKLENDLICYKNEKDQNDLDFIAKKSLSSSSSSASSISPLPKAIKTISGKMNNNENITLRVKNMDKKLITSPNNRKMVDSSDVTSSSSLAAGVTTTLETASTILKTEIEILKNEILNQFKNDLQLKLNEILNQFKNDLQLKLNEIISEITSKINQNNSLNDIIKNLHKLSMNDHDNQDILQRITSILQDDKSTQNDIKSEILTIYEQNQMIYEKLKNLKQLSETISKIHVPDNGIVEAKIGNPASGVASSSSSLSSLQLNEDNKSAIENIVQKQSSKPAVTATRDRKQTRGRGRKAETGSKKLEKDTEKKILTERQNNLIHDLQIIDEVSSFADEIASIPACESTRIIGKARLNKALKANEDANTMNDNNDEAIVKSKGRIGNRKATVKNRQNDENENMTAPKRALRRRKNVDEN